MFNTQTLSWWAHFRIALWHEKYVWFHEELHEAQYWKTTHRLLNALDIRLFGVRFHIGCCISCCITAILSFLLTVLKTNTWMLWIFFFIGMTSIHPSSEQGVHANSHAPHLVTSCVCSDASQRGHCHALWCTHTTCQFWAPTRPAATDKDWVSLQHTAFTYTYTRAHLKFWACMPLSLAPLRPLPPTYTHTCTHVVSARTQTHAHTYAQICCHVIRERSRHV